MRSTAQKYASTKTRSQRVYSTDCRLTKEETLFEPNRTCNSCPTGLEKYGLMRLLARREMTMTRPRNRLKHIRDPAFWDWIEMWLLDEVSSEPYPGENYMHYIRCHYNWSS